MNMENKNKMISLLSISVFTALTVILRCMELSIWNNEKVYVIGIILFTFAIFIFEIHDKLSWSKKDILCLIGIIIFSVALAVILSIFGISEWIPMFIPIVVIAVMYGTDSGICFTLFYSSFIYLVLYYDNSKILPDILLRWIIIGIIFSIGAKFTANLTQIAFSALTVIFSTTIVNILYFNLPYDKVKYDMIFKNMFSVIITLIVWFMTYILKKMITEEKKKETAFLEICEESYPPIAEYIEKADESYKHAVRVAEIAGLAALRIGADCELVSAGAMYHEIGKTVSSDYIKAGVDICEQYGIPDIISDIIIEHCLKLRSPKTVESAIVMLSDSAINSLDYVKANNQNVSNGKVIENVFKVRFESGALSECGMTIKQYNDIKEVFLNTFSDKEKQEIEE